MTIPKTMVRPAISARTGQWRKKTFSGWAFYPVGRIARACTLMWSPANQQWMAKILHWDKFEYLENEVCEDSPPFQWAEDMVNLSMEHIYANSK